MTPLEAFGLTAEADERAVKREYARRLKGARPDDDPDAFQALQSAYAAALEWVRNPIQFDDFEFDDEDAGDEIAVRAEVVDAFVVPQIIAAEHAPPRQRADDYDADALFARIVGHGRRGDAAGLRAMLANDPELWSLERKAWLRDALLLHLEEDTPAMAGEAFDAIVQFFHADAIVNPYEAWRRLRLRQRMHVAFVLQDGQERALAQHVHRPGEAGIPGSARWKRQLVLRARTASQRQLLALVPFVPTHLRGFLLRLDDGQLDDLPPPIDQAAVAFWDKAGDLGRLSLVRLGIGASRVVVFASLAFLLGWLGAPTHQPAVDNGLAAAAAVGILYAAIAGGVALIAWNSERQRRKQAEGGSGFNWWWMIWVLIVVANVARLAN